ncbi:protein FAM180A [Oncorhynchus nerka]|uniref:protein FAM180A n=1 Tax=Oncorhynchus nerka TaxID=8023 RepID=UPI00113205F4|nr:protein FAM180A [Oncorhynchus nerka]
MPGGCQVTMMPWKMVIVALFYCNIHTCATYRHNKVLYPSTVRVKRGMASMVNPTFQNSIEDVNLLFEILLAGLQFGDEHTLFSVQDEELASLRKTKKLEVICEDILPKTLSDIRRLTSDLSNHMGHLRLEDFERTVLTMVYTAQRLANATTDQQRDLWAESFVSLYRAIKLDLTAENDLTAK